MSKKTKQKKDDNKRKIINDVHGVGYSDPDEWLDECDEDPADDLYWTDKDW